MYAFFINGEELIITFSVFKVKPFSSFQFKTVVKEVCFLQGKLQHRLVVKVLHHWHNSIRGLLPLPICRLVQTPIRPLQGKAVFMDEIKKISSVNSFVCGVILLNPPESILTRILIHFPKEILTSKRRAREVAIG